MKANGSSGKLTAGGREVATLRDWRLETGPEGMRLEARLESINRWLLTFAPSFDMALALGKATLAWRGVDVSVSEDKVTITGGERNG